MIRNYLKVAARNLLKHKAYSAINILGLAVGIAASVLIGLYVLDELSYDRFHDKADRIYRVVADWSNEGDSAIHQLGTPSLLAKTLRDMYPQAETVTQMSGRIDEIIVKWGDKAVKESEVFAVEPTFFDVFTFPLLEGNPATALRDPNTLVLSERLAGKLFGTENPMGKSVEIQAGDDKLPFMVTGVAQNVPRNSHFRFEMLLSIITLDMGSDTEWTRNNFITYLLTSEGVTKETMEEKLVEIDKLYVFGGQPHQPWIWTLEPVTRIHLHADLVTGGQPNGSAAYVRLFAGVAVLILLIAGINFINLSTARSAKRAREVGIRKIVGSLKRQLVGQFLGESILISFAALVLAIGFIESALPFYRNLTGRELGLPYFGSPFVIPGLLGLALLVGFLSGLYPAFFLSSFKHTDVLKGSPLGGRGRGPLVLRNILVLFQFAMSILLIIGALTIFRQLDYIKNRPLGFDKEYTVAIHNADSLITQLDPYMETLKQHSDVLGMATAGALPGQGTSNWGIGVEGVPSDRPLNMNFMTCDQDFAETLGIRMVEGRFMSREHPSDVDAVVVNKKAVEYFGIPDPIGKKLRIWWTQKDLTIIGVIDDFHFESLHRDVRSMGYLLPEAIGSNDRPYLLVRVNSRRIHDIISFLRNSWQGMAAGIPFEFSFLDERVDNLYQNDIRAGRIVTAFSFLAIFVSCLGLLGLAAYVTEQRTKEIGVRKVLGARISNILWLLTRQFVKWVVVANLIAWPLGYWLMQRWLEGFAFHTNLAGWLFVASGLAALTIAVVTVSSQVLRAATANPADCLRYE